MPDPDLQFRPARNWLDLLADVHWRFLYGSIVAGLTLAAIAFWIWLGQALYWLLA
jgi:sterol desaturase/sphingolipid hydroxylase (fatty acid hydroxylase superfamily)